MHRVPLTLVCAFALAAAPALAQPAKAPAAKQAPAAKAEATKTATGTVTSVSGSSVTVKTASGDMTFNIDAKTHVVAPGGGTKSREAQAEGKAGVTAAEVLKTGQAVEVKYHETGMHAASIRTMASAPAAKAAAAASGGEGAPKPSAPKAETASGTVASVTGSSLTVKGASGESTFTVDGKTTVVGTGMGTAGRKVMAEGGKPTLGEFVKEGDSVSVTYKEAGGSKLASVIRVTRKKM
jgi:uncharacterized protein DUF5666